MRIVIFIALAVLLLGVMPTWPYSRGWSYFPTGAVALVFALVAALALLGYL